MRYMSDRLFIEHLEFQGHCGVTLEERQIPQPIAGDVELAPPATPAAAATDDLAQTVDYARVAERIVEIGRSRHFHLVETLAESLVAMMFAEFPFSPARLWVRNPPPPLKDVRGSVGVRVDRSRPVEHG